MFTGDLPATAESQEAAKAAGLSIPVTRNDMARQLLDLMQEKLPAKASPYDGMHGLYTARSYMELYLATGNTEDLEKARALVDAEADRYAQLVNYAIKLSPYDRHNLGRSETMSLQFLGEAVALKNYLDIIAAMPQITSDPELQADLDLLLSTSVESDLRIAPLLFMEGYDYATLTQHLEEHPEQRNGLLQMAVDILGLSQRAGIDPMAFSRSIMDKYSFTAEQWQDVL